MAFASTADLAAAVTGAGGYGFVGAGESKILTILYATIS